MYFPCRSYQLVSIMYTYIYIYMHKLTIYRCSLFYTENMSDRLTIADPLQAINPTDVKTEGKQDVMGALSNPIVVHSDIARTIERAPTRFFAARNPIVSMHHAICLSFCISPKAQYFTSMQFTNYVLQKYSFS